MFNHSIRVPRLYKIAAKIAQEVSQGKGSIKQLVYECKKHPNIKAIYALIVQTFQRTDVIEALLKKSKLLLKEPRLDPWLAKILITELIWGKRRLAGESMPVKTILAYEQIFKALLSEAQPLNNVEQVDKPRYVRINTLKITINEAIEEFRNEGWMLKPYTDTDNYLGFLDAVSTLGPEEFMVDLHIPYLLIFPPKTQFYQHEAYKNGSLILQDKASCLPVHILNPEPGSTILDMCAAPGMKTTHCAAVIQNTGQIYAVEIGEKRYETMNTIIKSSGATCVQTVKDDILKLNGTDYPNIDYIIVDPSCSGSGITDRVETGQQEFDQHQHRLQKLAGFQIKILRHALRRFPSAKRVVYSTCSIFPEENEDVVRQVLETCTTFKLIPASPLVKNRWQNFGSPEFGDIGNYCLYAKPDIDLTSGFFVAIFERLEEGDWNQFLNERVYAKKMQMIKTLTENQQTEEKIDSIIDINNETQSNADKIKMENIELERSVFKQTDEKQKVHTNNDNIRDVFDNELELRDNSINEIKLKRVGSPTPQFTGIIKTEKTEISIPEKQNSDINNFRDETGEGDNRKKKKKKKPKQNENTDVCDHLNIKTEVIDKHQKNTIKQKEETTLEEIIVIEEQQLKIKKKKLKKEDSKIDEDNQIYNPDVEFFDKYFELATKHEHKKKKKQRQESKFDETNSVNSIGQGTSISIKIKHKKEKPECINETDDYGQELEVEDKRIRKKRKKSEESITLHPENIHPDINLADSQEDVAADIHKNKKKKQKKSKDKCVEEEICTVIPSVEDDNINSTKRRHKKESRVQNYETYIAEENVIIDSGKKQKHIETHEGEEEMVALPKRKKKKTKHSTENITSNESGLVCEVEDEATVKPREKRKKIKLKHKCPEEEMYTDISNTEDNNSSRMKTIHRLYKNEMQTTEGNVIEGCDKKQKNIEADEVDFEFPKRKKKSKQFD